MQLQIKSKILSLHDKMDVLDENGNVVYRVHTKALTVHDKTYIENAAGNEVAYLHAKTFSIHHIYYVEMSNGESFEFRDELMHIKDCVDIEPLGWQLRGKNILEFDFQVFDSQENVLAKAHRKYVSIHDTYLVDVLDESKADEIVAIFVIMKHLVESNDTISAADASSCNSN